MTLQSLETGSPLHVDDDGAVRVGKTRVTLDSVVLSYHAGASAEQIAEKFPALNLGDIYATIAYYLWNRRQVNDYLTQRRLSEDTALSEIAERFPRKRIRERLMARRGDGTPGA